MGVHGVITARNCKNLLDLEGKCSHLHISLFWRRDWLSTSVRPRQCGTLWDNVGPRTSLISLISVTTTAPTQRRQQHRQGIFPSRNVPRTDQIGCFSLPSQWRAFQLRMVAIEVIILFHPLPYVIVERSLYIFNRLKPSLKLRALIIITCDETAEQWKCAW